MGRMLTQGVLGLALAVPTVPAWSGACFLSPMVAAGAAAAELQVGKDQVLLLGVRAFDNCERVTVIKGVALAQYLDDQGKPRSKAINAGEGLKGVNLDASAAPVRAVGRSLLSVLTDPKERRAAGQKYFDKPTQVGAPFGDVYIPRDGLRVSFVNLEGDARVQIADAATQSVVLDASATQGMTLDRARIRAGERYVVRVVSSNQKLPPGAFEVVAPDVANDVDRALSAIDVDPLLDADTRWLARALVFEREGLTFNRELALREMKK
jgi:hypothetical protein